MSKSQCELCHKILKGGEGMYRKNDDGKVIKICIDRPACQQRMRAKSIGLGTPSSFIAKSK